MIVDPDGALDDLERFAEWSVTAEINGLREDKRFEKLRGRPRFQRLVAGNATLSP